MRKVGSIAQLVMLIVLTGFLSTSCKKTCDDGKKNQEEEEVDCGGPCKPCSDCNDGIQSGTETGIDCGGDCTPCSLVYPFNKVASGTSVSLKKVECAGVNCAAIGEGGLLIVSTDKGVTWSSANTGTTDELFGIDISGNTIFICGEKGLIKKSTDLGQTFIDMTISNRDKVQWNDVLLFNDQMGIVGGSKLALSYTDDGGTTWNSVKYSFDSQRSYYAFSIPSDNALYAVGDNNIQLSSDFGKSWTQISLSDDNPELKNLIDVHYLSSSRAFITGEPSVLFSRNSIEWYDKALYTAFGGISFGSSSGLYAGRDVANERGKILETLDSGITWKQIPVVDEGVRFNDCFIIDESNSIVIGEKGTILRR